MVKHLLLLGDLGSGVNLIKNILFTDDDFLCPFNKKILDSIYDNHNANELSKTWLEFEYKTRTWQNYFGFDLSDSVVDNLEYKIQKINKPTIFINHSCFHNEVDRQKIVLNKNNFRIIGCLPFSTVGIEWQVRAYVEKKGIKTLHNFSFPDNVDESKQEYIKTHGEESYYKFNILNFFEAVEKNNKIIKNFCKENNFELFDTDNLYKGNFQELNKFGNIDIAKSKVMFDKWINLHWDYSTTSNWQYTQL